MHAFSFLVCLVGFVGLQIPGVSAIQTISQVGSKFFTADGNQWFVKGMS